MMLSAALLLSLVRELFECEVIDWVIRGSVYLSLDEEEEAEEGEEQQRDLEAERKRSTLQMSRNKGPQRPPVEDIWYVEGDFPLVGYTNPPFLSMIITHTCDMTQDETR